VVVSGACRKDPEVTTRVVTLHVPQQCAAGLPALDASAFGVYHALGDYEPAAPAGGHLIMDAGTPLPEIDPAARALLVDATEQDRTWEGTSGIAPAGGVDVLLLPSTTPCSLNGAIGARTAPAMAAIGGRVLVVGGIAEPLPGTIVFDLATGAIEAVPATQDLLKPRTAATVTAFGTGALVAGGIDARTGGGVLDEAEVYDPDLQGFDQQHPITLSMERAEAGAVVLATGETLLVGGVGGDGTTVLDSMEIVDPSTRTVRAENVARLSVARSAPTVLRLASGEVLVAGGLDASGVPVPTLEWFAADASRATKRAQDLVAGAARAYVALQSGGALAVIAPPPNTAASFQNTWVIDPDGALEPAAPVEGDLTQPILFGGAGGSPVLWTGGADARWLRWQPWAGSFGALPVLDDAGGRTIASAASPDPGTALWLDANDPANPRLAALRFDARGDYSTLDGPLLLSGTNDIAPDRVPAPGVVSFDPTAGLTLAPGASAFVTDRTYADVRVDVDAPDGEPALLVLRDTSGNELEVGGASCPGAIVTGAPSSLTVERHGAQVTWSVSGGVAAPCPSASTTIGAEARVTIGVRGAPDLTQSVTRNLRVMRLATPSSM
jgi:hypothetical protein